MTENAPLPASVRKLQEKYRKVGVELPVAIRGRLVGSRGRGRWFLATAEALERDGAALTLAKRFVVGVEHVEVLEVRS